MTDSQMLQNLLNVYEELISAPIVVTYMPYLPALKDVIAELRRRIALEELKND